MNTIVRAFAFALVLTGAAATTFTTHTAKATFAPRSSAIPVPSCPPDDPNGCGIVR